jgi:hypothetical protein
MAQKRRSSRYSRGGEPSTILNTFQNLIGFNPFSIEEEVERVFKETLKKLLSDFAKSMVDHDMSEEMANFKMEEHLASAFAFMEVDLERLSCWLETSLVNMEFIKKTKAELEASKQKKLVKLRHVMGLALKLSESIKNARIEELQKLL